MNVLVGAGLPECRRNQMWQMDQVGPRLGSVQQVQSSRLHFEVPSVVGLKVSEVGMKVA